MSGVRQPRGTAFALRDPLPWETFAGLARAGEEHGYAAAARQWDSFGTRAWMTACEASSTRATSGTSSAAKRQRG